MKERLHTRALGAEHHVCVAKKKMGSQHLREAGTQTSSQDRGQRTVPSEHRSHRRAVVPGATVPVL